jgi:hypothetical protein
MNNIDEVALHLANKALESRFDAEAYIVKYIAEKKLQHIEDDLIPESLVDDFIKELLDLFVVYYNDKTTSNLLNLMRTLQQVISELYNTCECKEEKEIIKQTIVASQKIYG